MATKEKICIAIFYFIFFSPKNLDQDLNLDLDSPKSLKLDPNTNSMSAVCENATPCNK
jgi:hypothetical protein